jgi:hypothetical protein
MRALATISAVILLGAGLAGCDMPGSQPQAAAPPCNCTTTPPATMTPPPAPTEHLTRFSYAPRHHYVHHRYYTEAGYHPAHYRSRYDIDRAQQSVDAYDYRSSSRTIYTQSDYSEGGYESGGYQGGQVVWVDGYGRGYFSNGPVTVAATMRGRRLDAYHGYDANCPDNGEPR